MPPTSIHFKVLIHKLHTGDERTQKPYLIYGFGGSVHDFTEVRFPGFLNECETCHLPGTYDLPLPQGVQPTVIIQDGKTVSSVLPVTAACTACAAWAGRHCGPANLGCAGRCRCAAGDRCCAVNVGLLI